MFPRVEQFVNAFGDAASVNEPTLRGVQNRETGEDATQTAQFSSSMSGRTQSQPTSIPSAIALRTTKPTPHARVLRPKRQSPGASPLGESASIAWLCGPAAETYMQVIDDMRRCALAQAQDTVLVSLGTIDHRRTSWMDLSLVRLCSTQAKK